MSEKSPNRLKNRVITATSGLAIVAVGSLFPNPAEAADTPTQPTMTSHSAELTPRSTLEPHPELLTISEDIQKIIDRDSIYINATKCSGMLVRNTAGDAIGFTSAVHCFKDLLTEEPTTSIGDKQYIVRKSTDIAVYTGATKHKDVGAISSVILPQNPSIQNATNDLMIGSLGNNDIAAVIETYKANQASTEEIADKTLYMGTWPVEQSNPDLFNRQDFAMVPIGKERGISAEHDIGYWTAVAATKDGAVCSGGSSGAQAFYVNSNGQVRYYGGLSLMQNLNNRGDQLRNDYSNTFGVDLRNPNIAAICGFSNRVPQLTNDYKVINFAYQDIYTSNRIQSANEFPDHYNIDQKYAAELKNPASQKVVLQGRVRITYDNFNEAAGTRNPSWIENPVVFYDPALGITSFGFADSTKTLGVDFATFSIKTKPMQIVPNASGATPTLANINGKVLAKPSKNGKRYGSLGAVGQNFGHVVPDFTSADTKYQFIYLPNGTVSIVPSPIMPAANSKTAQ